MPRGAKTLSKGDHENTNKDFFCAFINEKMDGYSTLQLILEGCSMRIRGPC